MAEQTERRRRLIAGRRSSANVGTATKRSTAMIEGIEKCVFQDATEAVMRQLNRRGFFKGSALAAAGIAVDTLSLDFGPSPDFATHYKWLLANRWGMECVANLGDVPATGATIVVGGPKIQGATGGPSRVLALV